MSKTAVYIEIGENLAKVFQTAIEVSSDNGESIYEVVNILSARIESMAITAVEKSSTEQDIAS